MSEAIPQSSPLIGARDIRLAALKLVANKHELLNPQLDCVDKPIRESVSFPNPFLEFNSPP